MELTAVDITALVITALLFLWAAILFARRGSYKNWLLRTINDNGFQNAVTVKDLIQRYCLAFDDQNRRVLLVKEKDVHVFGQKQCLCYLKAEYRHAEQDNVLRDSLKGYMIAGKTGATIYGLRSKPTSKTFLNYLSLLFVFVEADSGIKECRIPLLGAITGESEIDVDSFWGKSKLKVKDDLLRRFLDQLEKRGIPVYDESLRDEEDDDAPLPIGYRLPGAEN